ncbi:MAG: efflux RND transporter periplasmic adaptor subunit [Flavobacteriales bacterium]|nr:efflux RND transporter periplasmic adaptor subunit [Flavobacteriales bacterium]
MKKGKLISLIIFIVIVFIAAAYVIYHLYEKENEDPLKYKGQVGSIESIILKSVATGSVQPRKEIQIKPQISGIITELYKEAGESVSSGDLIAKVKVIPNMVNLNNAENRVNRAMISMENAQMDYDRNKILLDQEVIAPADILPFELALRNAKEEKAAAEDNLQIIKKGVAKRSGAATNTLVRSTISGMILEIPVEEGNSVIEANNFNDGTTIASVADMKDLIFLGKIDESEVEKLKPGMDLIVKIAAIEDKTFNAKLEYIAPKGIEENGAIQFEIKAALNMAEGEFIRAGYSANADVVLDRRDDVFTISESVVQYDKENKTFVEVKVENDTWERRDVELGLSDGLKVEVLSGLAESDSLKLWNQPIKR